MIVLIHISFVETPGIFANKPIQITMVRFSDNFEPLDHTLSISLVSGLENNSGSKLGYGTKNACNLIDSFLRRSDLLCFLEQQHLNTFQNIANRHLRFKISSRSVVLSPLIPQVKHYCEATETIKLEEVHMILKDLQIDHRTLREYVISNADT
jgi:hypothetical protein